MTHAQRRLRAPAGPSPRRATAWLAALGALLASGCARPRPELGARSEAPEYGTSASLPPLSPEALARLGGEPAPGASAAPAMSAIAAPVPVPRLPGTPEATPDGNYRLAGGGLEVVIAAGLSWQIRSISLDGTGCLLPEGNLGTAAAGGPAHEPAIAMRAQEHVEVEGSTLLVRSASEDGSLRSSQRYRLDAAGRALDITYGLENAGSKPLVLSSGEYARMPSLGHLTFAPIVKGVGDPKATLRLDVSQPIAWFAPTAAGWATASASEGWVATVNQGGLLLVRSFGDLPRGATGHRILIQAEPGLPGPAPAGGEARITVQAASSELAPGAAASFTTRWWVRRLPTSVAVKAGNQELLGFARGVIQ